MFIPEGQVFNVRARSKKKVQSNLFSKCIRQSLGSKTFLISEFQYLLPNASLSEKLFKRCQKQLSYYINKKKITKSPTHYLKFEDGGTSTTNLYFLYLATKLAWIPRLERYELIVTQQKGYRPPSWADCVIKS